MYNCSRGSQDNASSLALKDIFAAQATDRIPERQNLILRKRHLKAPPHVRGSEAFPKRRQIDSRRRQRPIPRSRQRNLPRRASERT